jgi:hypothetical protein
MSDQQLLDDQARLTEVRTVQGEQAEQGARKAPAQRPSDFIGTVRTNPAQIPVKQTVRTPKKR